MIFQDPYGSLNPRSTVGRSVAQPLVVAGWKADATSRAGRDAAAAGSGCRPTPGSAIRTNSPAASASASASPGRWRSTPSCIICDEPVSALDVSVRAQVINLLEDLKGQFGVSYLFISHDLSVVEHIADRVAVMYLGTHRRGRPRAIGSGATRSTPTPRPCWRPRRSPIPRPRAPANAACCRASCRARSIRRPAVRSTRAARSLRIAASSTGRCCGLWATACWQRAISSDLVMIRCMKPCLVALLLTALLPSAMASAQTMDFACPDPGTTFTFDSGTKVVARGARGHGLQHGYRGRHPLQDACPVDRQSRARRRRHVGLRCRAAPGTAVAIAGRQEDRGALQFRRPELGLHPVRGALREAHRPRRRPDRHLPDRDERSRAARASGRSRAGGSRRPTNMRSASTTATAAAAPTAPS